MRSTSQLYGVRENCCLSVFTLWVFGRVLASVTQFQIVEIVSISVLFGYAEYRHHRDRHGEIDLPPANQAAPLFRAK